MKRTDEAFRESGEELLIALRPWVDLGPVSITDNKSNMAAYLSGSSFFRHLQCRDLHQYLGSLPSGILDRLYNHPSICLAVFR